MKGSDTRQGEGRGLHEGPEAQKQLSSLVWGHSGTPLSFLLHAPGHLGGSPLPPSKLFYLALQPSHLGFQVAP